jgi:CheY-like chemotaxis protein/HPt (histidine-containing phosphotransfer) domain-containing protein
MADITVDPIPGVKVEHSDGQARCAVLVVDDVEINRELLRITLEKQGHRVVNACNGQEALDAFCRGQYDLVFMDMQMPVMDGYEAVRRIRAWEGEQHKSRTPIIAMTAYAMQGDRNKCLIAGMDDYLAKPARPIDVLAQIERLIPDKCRSTATSDIAPESPLSSPEPATEVTDDVLPVFDRAELVERLGGREDMLGRFIAMFLKNVSGYLEALKAAVLENDPEQVRVQSHTIKGAAANISARKMRETAAIMEVQAREGRLDGMRDLLVLLEEEFYNFRNETAGYV